MVTKFAETAPRKRAASTPKPAAANPAEVVTEERGTAKVAELTPHSYSTEVFESGDISDLVTDIALHGITKDLMVCGDGCASPRGTVLAGCRRLAAAKAVGLSEVPVLWVHGLDEWQEKHRILRDNKADQFGREWSKVLLATVEHELKVLYERRPGYRSDLDTRFGNKASPTARIVADEVGEKPSGFYARDKIFYSSPITTPVLKDAVGDGRISETWAATLLRDVEREFGIVQLVRDITSGKSDGEVRIHAARAKVSEAVAKRLAEPKKPRGRRRKAEASSESTERGAPAEPLKEMLDIEELARDIEAYWRAEEALVVPLASAGAALGPTRFRVTGPASVTGTTDAQPPGPRARSVAGCPGAGSEAQAQRQSPADRRPAPPPATRMVGVELAVPVLVLPRDQRRRAQRSIGARAPSNCSGPLGGKVTIA